MINNGLATRTKINIRGNVRNAIDDVSFFMALIILDLSSCNSEYNGNVTCDTTDEIVFDASISVECAFEYIPSMLSYINDQ